MSVITRRRPGCVMVLQPVVAPCVLGCVVVCHYRKDIAMETDSSKMYRLLGCAREYVMCQLWIDNAVYLNGRRNENIYDILGWCDQWLYGYQKVMDWITQNTSSHEDGC